MSLRSILTTIIWSILGLIFLFLEIAPQYLFFKSVSDLKFLWVGIVLIIFVLFLSILEFVDVSDISSKFLSIVLGADVVAAIVALGFGDNISFLHQIPLGYELIILFISIFAAGFALAFRSEYSSLILRHGFAIISFSYLAYAILYPVFMTFYM
jgi:hypothetical protein